jgi:hypothetical protein
MGPILGASTLLSEGHSPDISASETNSIRRCNLINSRESYGLNPYPLLPLPLLPSPPPRSLGFRPPWRRRRVPSSPERRSTRRRPAAPPSSSVRSPRPRPFSRQRSTGRCGATPRSRQPPRCGTRPPAGPTGRQRRRSSLMDATSSTGSSSWRRRPATAPTLSPRVTRSSTATSRPSPRLSEGICRRIHFIPASPCLVIVGCVS